MGYDNINYMDDELVKKIKESPIFRELQEHILENIFELNSIEGLESKSNLEAGEIVRARAIAVKVLKEILFPFTNLNEKKQPTEEEINKRKKHFGF